MARVTAEPPDQSLDDGTLSRQNRKRAFTLAHMAPAKIDRIAANCMDLDHTGLDALMYD
jgi:hypothetical protein